MLDAPPDSERQQLLGDRPDEQFRPREQRFLQPVHPVDRRAVEERGRGIDGYPPLDLAPAPDGVVVLERKPDRVHQLVAARAGRVGPVGGQPLAYRRRPLTAPRLFELRHVGRRGRRRHAQQVVEHPLAPDDR